MDDFIADVVAGRVQLPTIARVVQRLVTGLRRPDVSVPEIAATLAQDPVLSARVLRLANSPFYCGRRSLASIDDAVAVIGTDALRTLVVTCGVASAFLDVPGVNLRQFWKESVVTATAARMLLQQSGGADGAAGDAAGDAAYCAGLLLSAGHLILCQVHPAVAAAEFTRYRNLRGAALAAQEQALFGVAHPAVGALWVDRLGFPQPVGDAIRRSLAPLAPTTPRLEAAVQLGAALAAGVMTGTAWPLLQPTLDAPRVAHLGLVDVLAGPGFAPRYAALQALEWS